MASRALLLAAASLIARPQTPAGGHVYYQRLAAPDLDTYTNSPDAGRKQWFREHFARMAVFSPYFDSRVSWYPNSLVYINLYGVQKDSPILREHPDWILQNARGGRLYIPWGCKDGSCPQYAADVASPEFRNWWIGQARAILSRGYSGLWIDDVNLEFRVSDGNGAQAAPIDRATGRAMSWGAWRNYVASFTEEIRAAFPKTEIIHNSIWFAGPDGVRDKDASIRREIASADSLYIERGIASDANLTGGTGPWSIHALFEYIDRVHAAGRGVTLGEYSLDRAQKEYALAGYFLISSGKDRIGDAGTNPANWWSGYDVELGAPLGARTYRDGIYERQFSRGVVLLGEPGLARKVVTLQSKATNLSGETVSSVTISGRAGSVLLYGSRSQK